MSLLEMMKAMKLVEYKDFYMNAAAAIDLYENVREYGFQEAIKTISSYYRIDSDFISSYYGDQGPFVDETYYRWIEIIKSYDQYKTSQDFCIHSTFWVGLESEAYEVFEKLKTLPKLNLKFDRPRQIWRTRSFKDLIFTLFD